MPRGAAVMKGGGGIMPGTIGGIGGKLGGGGNRMPGGSPIGGIGGGGTIPGGKLWLALDLEGGLASKTDRDNSLSLPPDCLDTGLCPSVRVALALC